MIGLIGAMDEEVDLFRSKLDKTDETEKAGMTFYTGKLMEKDIVLVKSGVAKVNAAICTQILIDQFDADKIIFTGVAGALNPELKIGDVVLSRDAVHHDIHVRFLGLERGQIPYTDLRFFEADNELREVAKKGEISSDLVEGRIITGENFIEDPGIKAELRKELEGDCIEMEGAAVAQVCTLNKVPFLIIRTISDTADGEAAKEFQKFTRRVAENSYSVVSSIISKTGE